MTSKQRENFEREYRVAEIMLTGNEDYYDAQDKFEREIDELACFTEVEF